MTRPVTRMAVLATLAVGLCPACDREPLTGPPTLRLGRDECAECGMLISDARCAAALLVEEGTRRRHLMYDDIGCMLDTERQGLDTVRVIDRFVTDHETRQWIGAGSAVYLIADPASLPTPMGSGIAAFGGRAEADRANEPLRGRLFDFNGITEARKQWMEARFGKPKPEGT